MAYVNLGENHEGLKAAMNVLQNLAAKLPKGKQRKFGKDFLQYFKKTWINGSFPPETWNFYGHRGATTNNYNEGYNNKFNNSLNLHPHPNPYTCAKVIKDELLNAQDDHSAAQAGNPNIKSATSKLNQRKELIEKKQNLMKELHQERISLEKFLKSLGHMCMTNDQRIQHIIYDLTFDKPKDSSKIADAFLDESSIIENVSQNNLIGEELRAKRKNNLASDLTFHDKSLSDGMASLKNLFKSLSYPAGQKMSLSEGNIFVHDRLKNINFRLSTLTPGDGNCFLHNLIDQMTFDPLWKTYQTDPLTLRSSVVDSIHHLIMKGKIVWECYYPDNPALDTIAKWCDRMKSNDPVEYVDSLFIQLASELLSRKFIIFPVFPPENSQIDRVVIQPLEKQSIEYEPFYFLYYRHP